MMGTDFQFRDKISVAILGATGCVGQKFVELLAHHPWFEVVALAASERSVGKTYQEAVHWMMATPIPPHLANLKVSACRPSDLNCQLVFSGLDASVAGEIETTFANAGCTVVSNSRNHRWDPDVPLMIPEVNPGQLQLLKQQKYDKGKIITVPNCSATGLCLALKPIVDSFGLESVHVVTLQALSGAGHPGVASLEIIDNVIPYIQGEEEKLQKEPLKILELPDLKISAQCNRVPVIDGHLECVSIKLKQKTSPEQIIEKWQQFKGIPQEWALPSAPAHPLYYFHEENYPQPRLQRGLEKGMAVSIGHLRPCPLFDYKFNLLSHNTIRGAAGNAILTAELLLKQGHIFW